MPTRRAQRQKLAKPRQRGTRKGLAKLPRQEQQKLVPRPQMMARERILNHLEDLVGACEDLFAEHGAACACEACCVVSNLIGSVRVFRMLLAIT